MDNENKCKVNRKKRNGARGRAEIFANQMFELKQFLHNEINRGVNAAEVERKLDGKIDKIIAEVRDYERLEHLIDAKAKDAVSAVDKRMGIYLILFGAIISVIGIVGWRPLLNKAASLAIEKIGESSSQEIIFHVVSNEVHKAHRDIQVAVEKEIASRVPEMIAANVSDLRELSRTANENIKAMRSIVETMTTVSSARAGSRKHYNELIDLTNCTNNTIESKIARDAIKTIQGQHEQKNLSFDLYRQTLTTKEKEYLVYFARADLDHNCSAAVSDLIVLNNKEFVSTLVYVVKNTKRLDTLSLAIMGIERMTGEKFKTLDCDSVLKWWSETNKDPSFHSDYEWYGEMLEKIHCHSSREQIIQAYTNTINGAYKLIKEKPDFLIASKFIIDSIIALPDHKIKIADNRKSYFEDALRNLEESKYQDSIWYVNKTYYLAVTGDPSLNDYVNKRLSTNPEFEYELKKSRHFTEHFFNDKEIKWPSKLPPGKIKPNQKPDVLTIPLNRAQFVIQNVPPVQAPPSPLQSVINSGNISGYTTVEIKKGIQQLTDLPTNGVPGLALQKLNELKSGVCNGDSISWSLDGTAFKYKFDGDKWHDEDGIEISDEITIPAGFSLITYERTKDEKSKITVTISIEHSSL